MILLTPGTAHWRFMLLMRIAMFNRRAAACVVNPCVDRCSLCAIVCSQVDLLHLHERQEILPQLQALLEEGQAARAFIRDQVLVEYKNSWEMPAMHLVPHRTCKDWP